MTDRLCVKDYVLEYDDKKIIIEKGNSFMIPINAYHHDPKYFPEPEKFDPERFSVENRSKIDPGNFSFISWFASFRFLTFPTDTYLPFGIGPRNCIGSRFALMEVKTIFYYLLRNFSFEVTEKTQIPLKLEATTVGLKSEKGIWIALKSRD